jgi:hypothetical protein
MFHMLAARSVDGAARGDLETIRETIQDFFDCEDCRQHFLQIPFTPGDALTRRDAQLWLWSAHNIVNQHVKELEEHYEDGDPGFPKMQWPSAALCPDCRGTAPQRPVQRAAAPAQLRASSGSFLRLSEKTGSRRTPAVAGPAADGALLSRQPPAGGHPLASAQRQGFKLDRVAVYLDGFYGPRKA